MEWLVVVLSITVVILIWYIRDLRKQLPVEPEESEYARTIRRVHEQYHVPFDPERYGIKPRSRKEK